MWFTWFTGHSPCGPSLHEDWCDEQPFTWFSITGHSSFGPCSWVNMDWRDGRANWRGMGVPSPGILLKELLLWIVLRFAANDCKHNFILEYMLELSSIALSDRKAMLRQTRVVGKMSPDVTSMSSRVEVIPGIMSDQKLEKAKVNNKTILSEPVRREKEIQILLPTESYNLRLRTSYNPVPCCAAGRITEIRVGCPDHAISIWCSPWCQNLVGSENVSEFQPIHFTDGSYKLYTQSHSFSFRCMDCRWPSPMHAMSDNENERFLSQCFISSWKRVIWGWVIQSSIESQW